MMPAYLFRVAILIVVLTAAPAAHARAEVAASDTSAHRSKFIDPEDGWFDISAFLDTGHGFVPILIPVTEPAVGYGLAGALVFINRNPPASDGSYRRPNMSMVGGMGTENGTWAAFAGHSGSWRDDRLQTLVGGIYGSINLDFFGIGEGPLNENPIRYELEPAGGLVQARYRVGRSPMQLGLAYGFATIDASFEDDVLPEGITADERESRIGGLVPAVIFDSRDNVFTPTRGLYGQLESSIFAEAFGGTSNFERVNATALVYLPLSRTVFLGARGEAAFSFDDVPFYVRPYISLRGAPVLRYMGEHAASLEIEARWQFWRRVSAVGFAGAGIAWVATGELESDQSIVTGGGGLRYEIARRYGLHMGIDAAWGPDESAIYVQFGSAWFRP